MDLLSRNLEPRRHYGFLRSAAVLSCEDQETIDHETTKRQRVYTLVDILCTKGSRAFDALCGSLQQDHTQVFLLKALNMALERQRGKSPAYLSTCTSFTRAMAPGYASAAVVVCLSVCHTQVQYQTSFTDRADFCLSYNFGVGPIYKKKITALLSGT